MKNNTHTLLYILVAALFLGITAPDLFTEGMFTDGLLYAAVSNNMAHGMGSFWKPYLSYGLFTEFYEHPPLALGLQSIWFRILGDSVYVESFYALVTCMLAGTLIVLIWKEITGTFRTGWIPLLFWITVSAVPWACVNNMLENTMTVFICLSAWLLLKFRKHHQILMLVLSGLSLCLAVLTKGFVALYIWALPFFAWSVYREERFIKMVLNTVLLMVFTILPVALLYFLSPEASENMKHYFDQQVVGSIQNVATVNSRFAIIGKFLQHIVAPFAIGLIIFVIQLAREGRRDLLNRDLKTSLLFMLVVLSGILPIMISMKQRGFYIVSVYPFFAISLGYILLPGLKWISSEFIERRYRLVAVVTLCMVFISLGISAMHFNNDNRIRRDKNMILDCRAVIRETGRNRVISICPELYQEWSLHGYFARYGGVSLDRDLSRQHDFCLIKDQCDDLSSETYREMEIVLQEYTLLEKR